jgi:DNA processing protein
VAGNAKGIDTASAVAALRAGGSTIVVLPEGIDNYRVRTEVRELQAEDRTLVVSQFNPHQPWAAHTAMTRNHVVFGLSQALVVIEAGERGGTLHAGLEALKRRRPVFALDLGAGTPPGNIRLWEAGARKTSSRGDLGDQLAQLTEPPEQQSLL